MSNSRILDISFLEFVKIAKALNENTLANKTRDKDKKIPTDTFIRSFGINRKNFAATIKSNNYPISYNKSTFLYDIDESFVECVNAEMLDTSTDNTMVRKNLDKSQEKSEAIILSKSNNDLLSFVENKDKFFDMLSWYEEKKQKEILEANRISQRLDIDKYAEDLQGDVSVKYLKVYSHIFKRYEDLLSKYPKINKQDMISLALLLLCEKFE